ncbi:hypothetical protein [Nocardioides sp.]|uniref:hypothetical protein n=1 Tax=Nocardioides sp. TaxID=35761 RepID=UPI0031FE5B93|nr:hypothetical protein [Nocardioides sp.]
MRLVSVPDRWFLGLLVLVSTALRFPGLLVDPTSDESGFLLVARTWAPSTDNMFGSYWVDRPPVLIAAYRLADAVAGGAGPRLLAALLAAVLVVAVHQLARQVTDGPSARVAAVVAAALLANPEFSAWTAKGEVLGTPFVVLSCLASVSALQAESVRRRALLAAAAGMTAVLAVGFKQSLLGGLVFGFVLLVGSLISHRLTGKEAAHLARYALLGAAIPIGIIALWIVATPVTFDTAWYQIFGFRADASRVLAASDSTAPGIRARALWWLFIGSGMAIIAAIALVTCRRWLRGRVVFAVALAAMSVVDAIGVVVGGSYWVAYLIPLIPDIALAAALASAAGRSERVLLRATAGLVALASVVSLVGFTRNQLDDSGGPTEWEVGAAIGAVARPGDTLVSLYGSPGVVLAAKLDSPYEHLWSLPMRTLDPDLAELHDVLAGPDAPTWVVAVLPLDSWHLDPDRQIQDLISRLYAPVEEPCGPPIWLLRSSGSRALPPLDCS